MVKSTARPLAPVVFAITEENIPIAAPTIIKLSITAKTATICSPEIPPRLIHIIKSGRQLKNVRRTKRNCDKSFPTMISKLLKSLIRRSPRVFFPVPH